AQTQLADVIGKSRSHIANTLRLLRLPEKVQAYIREGKLSAGHARAILGLADPEAAATRIVEAGMNVRDAEALGQGRLETKSAARAAPGKDADTVALEKSIADSLGLAVDIRHGAKGGEVRIRYRTL